jgi:hypothetical protein
VSDGAHRPGLADGVIGPEVTTSEAQDLIARHGAAAIADPAAYVRNILPKLVGTLAVIARGPYGMASSHAHDVLEQVPR